MERLLIMGKTGRRLRQSCSALFINHLMFSAQSQIGWAGKAAPSGAQRLALERPHKLWQPFLSLHLSVVSVYALVSDMQPPKYLSTWLT